MVTTDDLAWTYCFLRLIARTDRPKMLLQNIHNHTRLCGVLTQTTLWILTTVSNSNLVPKMIKNWNVDGMSLWENWLKEEQYTDVPGGRDKIRESVPYVKIYRYNPKHLHPKLNGYGDNGQRKVWSSGGSTHCTLSADVTHVCPRLTCQITEIPLTLQQ